MVKIPGISSLIKTMGTIVPDSSVSKTVSRMVTFKGTDAAQTVVKTFPQCAKFHSFPPEVQVEITTAINKYVKNPKTKNISGFIDNLARYNPNHEMIMDIISSDKKLLAYCKSKVDINKTFSNINASFEQKEAILGNLAMMRVVNPQSYKALVNSKGMKEILANRLHISYLSNVTPNQKIGDNFFYEMFEGIEKSTEKRLSKIKGLDESVVKGFIKASDGEICKNPEFLENLLVTFEKSKNPELAGNIIKTFESKMNDSSVDIFKIIQAAEENPELVSKLIQMKDAWPKNLNFLIKDLKGDVRVFSDEMLDYFVKFQQKNSALCPPYALGAANTFLRNTNADENLLKTILNKSLAEKHNIDDVLWSVTENNIEFLRHNLQAGKFDKEIVAKLNFIKGSEKFKNPENWAIADKIYNETYLPFQHLYANVENATPAQRWVGEMLAEKRVNNPEIYKFLEQEGVIDLIKAKKINPRILFGLREGRGFTPELLSDIRMLRNNETLIKKFDNFDKILTKTKSGDVVSVKGQLYINNDGRLERWNMSEEKFNDLFPLVDRYTTQQGKENCYLITALDTLYRNPKSRGIYYKMFEQQGNDIFVTIPAYKDFKGKIKFANGEILTNSEASNAAKNVQMLEQAYARTALRKETCTPIGKDSLTTDDLHYLVQRNIAGHPSDVMREILLFNNNVRKNTLSRKVYTYQLSKPEDLAIIQRNFDKYGTNPKFLFNIALYEPGRNAGHALQVRSYNPQTKKLSIVDPCLGSVQCEKTVEELGKELHTVWTTVLK